MTALPQTGEGGGIFYFWFRAGNSSMSISIGFCCTSCPSHHGAEEMSVLDELLFPQSALGTAADFRFTCCNVSFTAVICLVL